MPSGSTHGERGISRGGDPTRDGGARELTLSLKTPADGTLEAAAALEPTLVVDNGAGKFTLTIKNVGDQEIVALLNVRPQGGFGELPNPNAAEPPEVSWLPPLATWPDSYVGLRLGRRLVVVGRRRVARAREQRIALGREHVVADIRVAPVEHRFDAALVFARGEAARREPGLIVGDASFAFSDGGLVDLEVAVGARDRSRARAARGECRSW